ncbi:MAG: hypothetical protein WKG01_17415 [Kofleriaceae bacterium]
MIASKSARGDLEKRSDALPFLFIADSPSQILVHKGRVVTERGAKVAGEYLRDLGIIDGTGPKIDDVLTVLGVLDAWPPVKGVRKEAYVHTPDNPGMAGSTARVEFDGASARVTLVYFLGEPKLLQGAQPGDEVGGMGSDFRPSMIREALRCVLTIPRTGAPVWEVTPVNIQ